MSTAMIESDAVGGLMVPDERRLAILKANLGGQPITERDLTRVTTPAGGGTTWSYNVNGNDVSTDEIVGLIVGVGPRGELWPTMDPSQKRPVVVSHDLITGYMVSNDLGEVDPASLEKFRTGAGTYDWIAMSNSQEFGFGAGKSNSKRLKESLLVAVLPAGEVWPLLVKIGPASVWDFRQFLRKLNVFQHEAIVGLRLERERNAAGQTYSKAVARLVGNVSPEVGEIYRDTYFEPIAAMLAAPPAIVSLD